MRYEVHYLTEVFGDQGYWESFNSQQEAEAAAERLAVELADAYPGVDDDRWDGWRCRDGVITVEGGRHMASPDDDAARRLFDDPDWEIVEEPDDDDSDGYTGVWTLPLSAWRDAVRRYAVWVEEAEDDE